MRFRDLFGLALGALVRQKVRTLLTTLSVVLGSMGLVISLSLFCGVPDTIEREANRLGDLRHIHVYPRFRGGGSTVPAEVSEVQGAMSEARRQRLREQAIRRWRDQQQLQRLTKLDPKGLDALEKIPGVHRVEPALPNGCRVFFNGKARQASITAAWPDDSNYRERVSLGSFFSAADAHSAVVSEDLLYRLGVADDAALAEVVGKKLRLEFGEQQQVPSLRLVLQAGAGKTTLDEERALKKVLARLPEAVATLKGLTSAERSAALTLLQRTRKEPAPKAATVTEELTICGVLRLAAPQKDGWRWDQPPLNPDLIVPAHTAEAILLRLPEVRTHGFGAAIVTVEHLEDVKPVTKIIIDQLGFGANSRSTFVEREKFTYRLVFFGMAIVAVVALLVAALGIMNTMLMSVLERVREIGVMKAVGARDRHIQLIFLIEGALLGLVGGLLGLLLSRVVLLPVDPWVRSMVEKGLSVKLHESLFVFPWWLLVGVPVFACVVTTVAAYYPARRAARINPVRALRHE